MRKINLVVSVIYILFVTSCQQQNTSQKKECCLKDSSAFIRDNAISEESIYNLTSTWLNQDNDSILLSHFKDKIVVAAMVFTYCESACPRIVSDIKRIEKEFNKDELNQIHFVLISMDPARDTPSRFKEFAQEYQLNENWTMISSSEFATMEIANILNVRIKKLSTGGFDHSNTIHIINQVGEISFQQNGLEQDPSETINNIKSLLK